VWSKCFTGQALGKRKVMRCLLCRTWTAIFNNLPMTVDGCACDRAVCCSALGRQLLMQDIGSGMQQQAHAIGNETGTGSAVSRQVGLQMLDEIFRLAARAIDAFVQGAGVVSR
jgi:hypothetical protein